MKIKDTYHGLKGEAMKLIFNKENFIFFDQYASKELEKPSTDAEWVSRYPEAHYYEYHVTGYMSSLLYVGGLYNYIPTDPTEYYEATHLGRLIEKFNDICLLYLLNEKEDEKLKAKPEVLVRFDEIILESQRLLVKHKNGKHLCGTNYTIADFALVGLLFGLLDQPIAEEIMKIVKKYKEVEEYLLHHREAFLPHLLKGGRFTTWYVPAPYSTIVQIAMSSTKIRTKIVESPASKLVVAGLEFTCIDSAIEMLARTLGLLKNDHIFENLYYKDIASSVLFSEKPRKVESLQSSFSALNNYYGYLTAISKGMKWPMTLADIYSAVALEDCCKQPELAENLKKEHTEAYNFHKDFLMRHKRAKHCVIFKSDIPATSPLPPSAIGLIKYMNNCRHDLHDVMRNLGFKSAETLYPLQSNYKEIIDSVLERKEYKDGDLEIFAYLDANEATDMMVGYSALKYMESRKATYAAGSYEFAYITRDKSPMKEQFIKDGVPTAPYVYLDKWDEGKSLIENKVEFPVVIKLSDAYASFGMSKDSKCKNMEEVKKAVLDRFARFNNHPVLIESFITGPEFTVVVAGNYDQDIHVFHPTQRVFDESVPEEDRWLYYEFYWKSATQKLFFKKVQDEKLAQELTELARKTYISNKGYGYGRVDIRQDKRTGKLIVLEINCMCCVGFESTSFYVLKEMGLRTEDLFEDIFYYGKLRYATK